MPLFTTSFTVPPALAGLAADPDLGRSSVVLTWTISGITGNEFWRYFVYRRNTVGNFVRIGEVADQATATYTDIEAPHGSSEYAVTVSNGWDEGDPDTVSVELPLDYWIVDPNDQALVFQLPHVSGYDENFATQREQFAALGRKAPIAVDRETLPAAGNVALKLLIGEGGVFDLILRAAQSDPWIVLKSPFGDVHRVRLADVKHSRGGAGTQDVAFSYLTVDV